MTATTTTIAEQILRSVKARIADLTAYPPTASETTAVYLAAQTAGGTDGQAVALGALWHDARPTSTQVLVPDGITDGGPAALDAYMTGIAAAVSAAGLDLDADVKRYSDRIVARRQVIAEAILDGRADDGSTVGIVRLRHDRPGRKAMGTITTNEDQTVTGRMSGVRSGQPIEEATTTGTPADVLADVIAAMARFLA